LFPLPSFRVKSDAHQLAEAPGPPPPKSNTTVRVRPVRAPDGLEALREHNPLLFDFALKRRARWRGARLTSAVFHTRRRFVDTQS